MPTETHAGHAGSASPDSPIETGNGNAVAEKPKRTPEELARVHAENARTRAMDKAFSDIRQRSYDGKLTTPARWKKLALAPEGMDAADFEELALDFIEDEPHAEDKPVTGHVEAPKPLDAQLEGTEVNEDELLPKLSVEDIAIIYGKKASYLYSVALMSHSFAHALFHAAEEDDLSTFIDVVREESRIYPRPVSENCFMNAPYLWSHEKTGHVFDRVRETGSFKDIKATATSQGETFYYSDIYLSDAQAKSLAEWYGVEKGMNP